MVWLRVRSGRAWVVAVAASLALGSPAVAGAQEKKAGRAADQALQQKVDRAVERAVKWLLKKRGRKGDYGAMPTDPAAGALNDYSFPAGLTALAYFTLLTAGVPPKAPAMRAIYRRLRRRHARPATTYETAVLLMAIDARYGENVTGRPRSPVPPAAAGRDATRVARGSLYSRDDWKWVVFLARFLEDAQWGGGWRYWRVNTGLRFNRDVSATVFALMGLVKASRAGYAVHPTTFQQASTFLCDLQERRPDLTTGEAGLARGFPYGVGRSPEALHVSGGTTAAGLAALHLCRLECRRLGVAPDRRTGAAIRDATRWLAENWEVQRNPKAHHHHHCYLYALERVGSLSGRETIGRHRWYADGAAYLLGEQQKSGRWLDVTASAPKELLGTCFAVLFLKRATRAVTEPPPPAAPKRSRPVR